MSKQATQEALIEMPVVEGQPAAAPLAELPLGTSSVASQPNYRVVERNQKTMAIVDVEELIGEDHKV